MTALVFDFVSSLFGLTIAVLALVKIVAIYRSTVAPVFTWIRDNRGESLRQTLVYFGIIVDDDEDDTQKPRPQ